MQSNVNFNEEDMDEETAELIRRLLEEDRMEQNLRNSGIALPQPSDKTLKSTSSR